MCILCPKRSAIIIIYATLIYFDLFIIHPFRDNIEVYHTSISLYEIVICHASISLCKMCDFSSFIRSNVMKIKTDKLVFNILLPGPILAKCTGLYALVRITTWSNTHASLTFLYLYVHKIPPCLYVWLFFSHLSYNLLHPPIHSFSTAGRVVILSQRLLRLSFLIQFLCRSMLP